MFYEQSSSYSARSFMYSVYAWMFGGLMTTAGIAYYIGTNTAILKAVYPYMMPLMFAQLGLVLALSFLINRINFAVAAAMFMVYAASVGVTMSVIFAVYTAGSIYATFAITAGMFGAMAIYGYTTRADLTTMGNMCLMALFGLIIGLMVNLFLKSAAVDFVLSGIGVVVFTLLTAYDVQKIKQLGQQIGFDGQLRGLMAVYGALALYLDFINLFLYLLRFFGNRRNN